MPCELRSFLHMPIVEASGSKIQTLAEAKRLIHYERAINVSVCAKSFRIVGIEKISPTVLLILACVEKALELWH